MKSHDRACSHALPPNEEKRTFECSSIESLFEVYVIGRISFYAIRQVIAGLSTTESRIVFAHGGSNIQTMLVPSDATSYLIHYTKCR